jgi:hypothetical protein
MIRPKGAVEIEQVRGGQRTVILDAEGIPAPPTALALDGSDLWVGGEGYVALVDLKLNRVKRFSYVRATEIDSIQVAGGYVWAKYECHLHRAPLRDLQ